MQGKSADYARHAIPSIPKQRILVTFTKSQPKKTTLSDGHRSHAVAPNSHWGPPPSRSPNHIRHPVPKHYGPVPTTGVLPAPTGRAQLAPPNGIQPLFVPAPVAQAVPFPAPVALPPASGGWPAPPARHHPPPRLPLPGTGVFLPPPGSGNSSTQQSSSTIATETTLSAETPSVPEKDDGLGKPNGGGSASPKGEVDGKTPGQECNGSKDGTGDGSGRDAMNEEQQHGADSNAAGKPAGTV